VDESIDFPIPAFPLMGLGSGGNYVKAEEFTKLAFSHQQQEDSTIHEDNNTKGD